MSPETVLRPAVARRAQRHDQLRVRGGFGFDWLVFVLLMAGAVMTGTALPGATGIVVIGVSATGVAYIVGKQLLLGRLRPGPDDTRVISDAVGLTDLALARDAAGRIEAIWPALGDLVSEAPGPVLADSLWDLAGDLRHRAEVRQTVVEISEVVGQLPADDPTCAQLTNRLSDLTALDAQTTAAIDARVQRLIDLADQCEEHVARQAALTRADDLARRADLALGVGLGADRSGDFDAAADLAGRTEAVLHAYRELRGSVGS